MAGGWLMAVDGTGMYVRCSRAARGTGMSAPDGTPTGALVIFAQSLAAMVRQVGPDYLVITWDGPHGTAWRKEICPGYKANRAPYEDRAGADARGLDAVREFCGAAGIEQWTMDDFEGDDLLAAASRLARRDLPGVKAVIASDDNDVAQLAVPDQTWIRTIGRDGTLTDADSVELMYGVRPEHVPMLRALSGDRSDGIPGIPGIGPVSALRILTLARFRWPLPAALLKDEASRQAAGAWLSVMDLNNPPKRPEDYDKTGILDIRKTEWTRGNILPVLEKYEMRSMAERLLEGRFW